MLCWQDLRKLSYVDLPRRAVRLPWRTAGGPAVRAGDGYTRMVGIPGRWAGSTMLNLGLARLVHQRKGFRVPARTRQRSGDEAARICWIERVIVSQNTWGVRGLYRVDQGCI